MKQHELGHRGESSWKVSVWSSHVGQYSADVYCKLAVAMSILYFCKYVLGLSPVSMSRVSMM